ncbi:MAG: ABC transporter permease [Fidelibacterota bacterium]|nr:MAG: ABC transporter permease [Candidatus Neomarinimicrobiota bacterium]
MRGLWPLAWSEFRLNLRDPMMVFWSLAFPALWLVFNAVIFSEPIPGSGYEGLNHASFLLPGGISLVILCASFIGVPITLTNYREKAVLKRLRVTPVKTATLALSFSISNVVFTVVGILVLLIIGRIFFDIQVLGSWVAFIGVIFLGMVTFLAIGSAIGSIAPSFRAANIIIWTIFTPMIMLSELFLPIAILPAWIQPIARAFPLTPINTILRDIVYGVPLDDLWRLGVLAGWIVIAGIITVRFFRWE